MIFLSPREWLAQWPRRLQCFAVAMLLLATLAQSWHVCAMSGHSMSGHEVSVESSHGDEMGGHKAKKFKVLTNADGTPGPVICQCARDDEPGGFTFSATPKSHGHVTCLALLLQTMPLQAGVPFTFDLKQSARVHFAARAEIKPAFAAPFALRGRAPPQAC